MRPRRVIAVLLILGAILALAPSALAKEERRPQTGFEERGGASWTTHREELKFLAAVDAGSERASVEVIGTSLERLPLHLVSLGNPIPRRPDEALDERVALFVCTQHGDEPAGREACLQWLRDLAFTRDRDLLRLLEDWTVLFIPTANPDGRAANVRENANGIDINRDHLNLESPEAQTIARVIRDWRPDVLVDLHEYGPGMPVVYDDDVLYLWPRNLNVDPQVYALSKTLAIDYIGKGAQEAGFTSDEYGLYAVGDQNVAQTAGDGDEGILRNAAGLRHVIGILVETRVTMDPRTNPEEVASEPAVNLRRVASHQRAIFDTLRFMREQGSIVELGTEGAPARKLAEGKRGTAPVYFGGADNDPPEPAEVQDPPPCGYLLTAKQARVLRFVFALHGIDVTETSRGPLVSMAQSAEPLIPLLLDSRGIRHAAEARPLETC